MEEMDRKIESRVFDRRTLLGLNKLMGKGVFDRLESTISMGKEAVVFSALQGGVVNVAVKIYMVETSPFLNKTQYLFGDPRFNKVKHTKWNIICAFARKEFKNLHLAREAGVSVPRPVFVLNNIVVMEFLGEGNVPFPKMAGVRNEVGKEMVEGVLEDVKRMDEKGLVHADLSPYNILVDLKNQKYWIIDFAQGVVKGHPNYAQFLERDVRNINAFLKKITSH